MANDHRHFPHESRDDRYGNRDDRARSDNERAEHWRHDPRDAYRRHDQDHWAPELEAQTRRYPLGGFGGDYEDDAYRRSARSRAIADEEPHASGRRLLYGDRDYADRWRGGSIHDDWRGGRHSSPLGRAMRGPKGYTRTDERIREDICERLMACWPRIDASEVSVAVKEGVVTLEGTVPERRMKHAIEDLAEHCVGVSDVENRMRVSSGGNGASVQAAAGTRADR